MMCKFKSVQYFKNILVHFHNKMTLAVYSYLHFTNEKRQAYVDKYLTVYGINHMMALCPMSS